MIKTVQELTVRRDQIKGYRTWVFVSSSIYLLWSVAVKYLLAATFDVPSERALIFILFWSVGLSSYFFKFVQRHFELIVVGLATVFTLHFLSIAYRSNMDPKYCFAMSVVSSIVATGFSRMRYFKFYILGVVLVEILMAAKSGLDLDRGVTFIGYSFSVLAAMGFMVRMKETADDKVDKLLRNMLPERIAMLMRNGDQRIAEQFSSATVLFADIVGFSQLARTINSSELIRLLDELFSEFDRLADKYEVEKIKTIGDCYMAACGVPEPCSDHQRNVVAFAFEILDFTKAFSDRTGSKLGLRIGINTGPVIAGVIGDNKTIYDLWGDTVNLASRMESHGSEGRIQIPASACDAQSGMRLTDPSLVKVKGIGEISARFIESIEAPEGSLRKSA